MCGISGIFDLAGHGRACGRIAEAMSQKLIHRGPDSGGCYVDDNVALAARRLRIVDLEGGDQPITNEDGTVILVCNGEIFNYRGLRQELEQRGHRFRSRTDVEVLVHLYEEEGAALVDRLNGQFAFALYDRRKKQLLLARDHFGIAPLYFTRRGDLLIFGSEIKAILEHPEVPRRVDPVGLDQVLTLPGLVSPRTLFEGIESLPGGHLMNVAQGEVVVREYWDLDYPESADEDCEAVSEEDAVDAVREVLEKAVRRRLHADVGVGLFLSGGLDSSLVAATAAHVLPGEHQTFSVTFPDQEIDEGRFQRRMARELDCAHHEILIDDDEILGRLQQMIYHCECPVKETFNTCALALAEATRAAGITVVLAGQGADELFGGYPGYRFDAFGEARSFAGSEVDQILEEELRERLWGDRDFFYERDQIPFMEIRQAMYSRRLNGRFPEVDCLAHPLVNQERLRNRSKFHRRSYLDVKLRLADHLLTDHGDRMVMAHSLEGRYPFLDIELVDLARRIPPRLKLKDFTEKYIIRKVAQGRVPQEIIEREKFGFRAPGSPLLLQRRIEWVLDLLSYEEVRRWGFFDPDVVERLKLQYSQEGHRLHPHLEIDLLMIAITLHLLCRQFDLEGPT